MSLKYHPNPGAILVCRYEPGFVAPEMVKTRPVVVISPRLRRRDSLCTVVPLSSTEPAESLPYQCKIVLSKKLPPPWDSSSAWVKADMLATVGFHRLDMMRLPRDQYGKRKYLQMSVSSEDLKKIRACVLHALNLGDLTGYL